MKFTTAYKTMEQVTGEAYSTMLSHFEDAKRHLGKMVLDSIEEHNWVLERNDAPELFELIDLYQLDDAYILASMNYEARLHSERDRTGTHYESQRYEVTLL